MSSARIAAKTRTYVCGGGDEMESSGEDESVMQGEAKNANLICYQFAVFQIIVKDPQKDEW